MTAAELVGSFGTVFILGWVIGVKFLVFKRLFDIL